MACQLLLATLAGNEVSIPMNIAQYDRFADLEDHMVDYLATVTWLDVFGSEVDRFIQARRNTCKAKYGMPYKSTRASTW